MSAEPLGKINRFSMAEGKIVEMDCPNIVKSYNKHVGRGGDGLLDTLLDRYKIKTKTRKCYVVPPFRRDNCTIDLVTT